MLVLQQPVRLLFKWISMLLVLLVPNVSATPLLLISIDGFTPKYLELYQPPFLSKLAKQGAFSSQMRPVFPSKTFPNHISIVTGVYPQKHGIIHNDFYHPEIGKQYSMGMGKSDSRWLTAKPIWALAEQQGIKTATYFWPESEVPVQGVLATYMQPYDGKVPNAERLQQVIDWLALPADSKPEFLTTYFSLVDTAGHDYGIHSVQARAAVLEIDTLLAEFYQQLQQRGLDDLNMIIVSDHGMTALAQDKAIAVPSLGLSEQLNVVNGQTQLNIYHPDKKLLQQTKALLLKQANGRYQVEQKGSYPQHWHLDSGVSRIPDLIVNAHPPFSFLKTDKHKVMHSTHGFDPYQVEDMYALFIAYGPGIKPQQLPVFNNVDVMPLMLKLLGMSEVTELDGDLSVLGKVLN